MMRAVFFLSRLAFGAVFVYAGALKMADAQGFALTVFNYQILPSWMVYGAAMAVPAVEVVCGLAMWAGSLARGASVVLNAMMVAFLGSLGWAMARGLDIDCGCFGQAGHTGMREAFIRDVLILALGIVAMAGAFLNAREDG